MSRPRTTTPAVPTIIHSRLLRKTVSMRRLGEDRDVVVEPDELRCCRALNRLIQNVRTVGSTRNQVSRMAGPDRRRRRAGAGARCPPGSRSMRPVERDVEQSHATDAPDDRHDGDDDLGRVAVAQEEEALPEDDEGDDRDRAIATTKSARWPIATLADRPRCDVRPGSEELSCRLLSLPAADRWARRCRAGVRRSDPCLSVNWIERRDCLLAARLASMFFSAVSRSTGATDVAGDAPSRTSRHRPAPGIRSEPSKRTAGGLGKIWPILRSMSLPYQSRSASLCGASATRRHPGLEVLTLGEALEQRDALRAGP